MKSKIILTVGFLFLSINGAKAQTSLPLLQPGRLSDFEDPLKKLRQSQDGTSNPGSILDSIQLDESARPKPENKAGSLKFILNSLKVVGNTVLDEKLIADQLRSYLGQPVTGADLQEMAASITRLYVASGFSTSRCIVPAQKVDDGSVVLQIEEDRLGAIQLSGLTSYRFDARYFVDQVNDLRGKVISVPELEERLRLVARIPGARVKPTLKKSTFGLTDLVLEISDIDNIATVSFTNDGSKMTSIDRASIAKTFNNVSGSGDVLSLSATTALNSPQYYGGLNASYQRPFGYTGGRLNVSFSGLYYLLNPTAVGNNTIRYQGDSYTLEMNYEEPIRIKPEYGNALWFAGLEHKTVDASTVYNSAGFDEPAGFKYVAGQDRTFALTGGVRWEQFNDFFGLRGRTLSSLSVKHALPGVFGSMSANDITNKLDNLAAASTAVTNASNAATAVTNAAAILAATSPTDGALYTAAMKSYIDASTASTAAQAKVAQFSTVYGPIGDARGMVPDFTKFYFGLSRAQNLPSSFLLDGSFLGEWTNAKRVPQSYDFVGANNGPRGLKVNVLVTRPIEETDFVGGLGLTHMHAYSYFHDASGGGAPGCQNSQGTYANTSVGLNQCSDTYPYMSLTYRNKYLFGEFTYLPKIAPFAPNLEKLRANLGFYW